MFYIYKLTSPNYKIYIGSTNDIKRRWDSQYKYLDDYKYCKESKQTKIANSIYKYGWNNFGKEILMVCNTEKECDFWESFYGHLFNSLDSKYGLNLRLPKANDRKCFSDDSINKMKIANAGINNPQYGKKGVLNKNYGKKQSLETILKRTSKIKGNLNCNAKQVINLKTNVVYGCVRDAAIDVNINYNTLRSILNGDTKKNETNLVYLQAEAKLYFS